MKPGEVPPLLLAVTAQLLALLLVLLLDGIMPALPEARLILQGSIASLVGRLLRLPYWWGPINLLLPLALAYTTRLGIQP